MYTSTSDDYTEVIFASDAHASYLQLLQHSGHALRPDFYQKSANINVKIKPMSWSTKTIREHLHDDILNARSILQVVPPASHFVDAKRKRGIPIDSRKNKMKVKFLLFTRNQN